MEQIGVYHDKVALFTRAWIEIHLSVILTQTLKVALFTRAWIEIVFIAVDKECASCRPLHEGVD